MSITPIPRPGPALLWRVDLDTPPADTGCLSQAERERAGRFVFARDRERFVAAHVALRQLLSSHTGIAASELEFVQGEAGKPSLIRPAGLQFNLSHSKSVALIAIGTAGAEIGVDVEVLRSMPDADAMAASYFTEAEQRALAALPPARRERAFLACWTRKEACLKAIGLGLGVDTRSFEAGVDERDREVRIPVCGDTADLSVSTFDGGEGVVCAIARRLRAGTRASRPTHESEFCA
ncbi:4'-phosphopantetheinyl transferase [Variovorax sp. HW608]|uniref:4'-phosphopantetheinyl transferase family protein n=1 Tax=Variovorax sp. HW608 TaxID=1034889 RepID=UPI00081FDC4B|nr:4'-phosphopantetheinyl transferase superfamily protein [Variovorax sp. HW608]SCK42137.1 4'-phosphopantetheinyl transferase [Variovorax sp. HW608]